VQGEGGRKEKKNGLAARGRRSNVGTQTREQVRKGIKAHPPEGLSNRKNPHLKREDQEK